MIWLTALMVANVLFLGAMFCYSRVVRTQCESCRFSTPYGCENGKLTIEEFNEYCYTRNWGCPYYKKEEKK